ncbi:MAG: hypothetical protein DRJ01_05660 [Bacteroidetes bacterium]|nr:MAG: hypothetical protein DRJ01_05660 [Bacteroidota bacterium]
MIKIHKPFLLFIFISFLLLIQSCKENKTVNKQEHYFCDAETMSSNGKYFISNNIHFKVNNTRSTDFAHSGNYSIKLDKTNQYGMTLEIKGIKKEEHYRASVWQYGNNGMLVASNSSFWFSEINRNIDDSIGWHKLSIDFFIPPNNTENKMKIYLWNPDSVPAYFDDLKVDKIPPKKYPEYKQQALRIYVDQKDMDILKEKRKLAFEKKILETDDSSYVNAIVFWGGDDMKAKIRLKGDWLDHLKGDKWSFRIKLKKKKTWKGMRTFSIQTPEARYFIDEWLAHKIFEKEDVLTTRYNFIPVYLNNKNLGLYAYEEHFEKQLVENKNRREGPILKFSEDQLWASRVAKQENNFPLFEASKITAFKSNRILREPTLLKNFIDAQNLVYEYKYAINKASNIFDVDKLAKYFALADLTRAYHGFIWHNQRFYYNPVLSKLEFIPFDCYCDKGVMQWTNRPIYGNYNKGSVKRKNDGFFMIDYLFADKIFVKKYLNYLQKYSSKKYLNSIFSQFKSDIKNNETLIQKEFADYKYDYSFLTKNALEIRKSLPDFKQKVENNYFSFINNVDTAKQKVYKADYDKTLPKYFVDAYSEQTNKVRITNYYPDNIEIVGISNNQKLITHLFKPKVLLNSYNDSLHQITLEVDTSIAKYLFFIVKGKTDIFNIPIFQYQSPKRCNPQQKLIKNNDYKINSIFQITKKKNLIVKAGNYTIKKSIIIPAGYKVIFKAGANLNFINNSFFLSYSPVFMQGLRKHPVTIKSTDGTAMGFTVLQAKQKSFIKDAVFEHLNTLNYKNWNLTGAVTFYESDVEITSSLFNDNNCEDALNIIRSNFFVHNSSFDNIFADAFDSDFSKGKVLKTFFSYIGNDAIDFSGSNIFIDDCEIINARDKGISGGENSQLTINNVNIKNSNIAFASKDFSFLDITSSSITNCNYGIVIYKKKPEYGPATVKINKLKHFNINKLYFIEKKSKLISINDTTFGFEKHVFEKLYN